MKKILTLTLMLLVGASALSSDAYAKRFGGGKSLGKQREQVTQPAAPRPAAAPAPAPAGGRSWLGPIAGLVAGGLLASMFMGGGFDGFKMFDFLLIAALAFGAFWLYRKFRSSQAQAQAPMQFAGVNPAAAMPFPSAGSGVAPVMTSTRPEWFEDEPFLRAAKGNFLRLQEAYDRADLNDMREFTTPEVFAEIRLQVDERGSAVNKTEVVQLNATMADVVTEAGLVIASVRFSGSIREDGADAQAFDEIWHIQKSATDRNASWFVSGIQQM